MAHLSSAGMGTHPPHPLATTYMSEFVVHQEALSRLGHLVAFPAYKLQWDREGGLTTVVRNFKLYWYML